MNTQLTEYRAYLEHLAKEKSQILFSNGGKEYAAILMSILLNNTQESICMFCEGFKPDLITEPDYWEALTKYVNATNKTLKVLVNSTDYINAKPLRLLFEAIKKSPGDNRIQIKIISKEGREIIRKQFNGELNNFAVFDDSMYRLEYNPTEYKAFGSFNRPEESKMLKKLFNEAFDKSRKLNDPAA